MNLLIIIAGISLLILLGALLVLLLLAVLMPVRMEVLGAVGEEDLYLEAAGTWAWGVLGVRWSPGAPAALTMFGRRVKQLDGDAKKTKSRKKKEKKESRKRSRGLGWLARNRSALTRAARKILGALHLELKVAGVVGPGDPADAVALEQALFAAEELVPGLTRRIRVEYLDDVLELRGAFRARIWPAGLLATGVSLLFDRGVRRALFTR